MSHLVTESPALREVQIVQPTELPQHPELDLGYPQYSIATTLQDVTEAWEVVYKAYLRTGLIDPNPWELHTSLAAIGPHSAVVVGRRNDQAVATATSIFDGPEGLPLDSVYANELHTLRQQGCRLVEIGLLAEHHDDGQDDAASSVFESTGLAYHFARYLGATDVLCGMHPRRTRLYQRLFGFEQAGQPRTYSTVKNHPVVLMRANLSHVVEYQHRYRAIQHFMQDIPGPAIYQDRFRFDADDLRHSTLGQFIRSLRYKRRHARACA